MTLNSKTQNSAVITQWTIKIIFFFLLSLLVVTRFYRLDWGFPYLMHPDENNMARAVSQLRCYAISNFQLPVSNWKDCLNPHFFAYGQLQLYMAAFLSWLYQFFFKAVGAMPAGFYNLILRIIASCTSIISGIVLYALMRRELKSVTAALIGLFFFVASPGLIQQAHFGTTESLLALLLLLTLYSRTFVGQIFWVGLATALKPSGILLAAVPLYSAIASLFLHRQIFLFLSRLFFLPFMLIAVAVLFSPHYALNFNEFIRSFNYESAVGTGQLEVFYTTQFAGTIPVLFQFTSILPYALGIPLLALSLFGILAAFFSKKRELYLLLAILLALFITQSVLYAKWTRFIAPLFPLFIFFAAYAIDFCTVYLRKLKILFYGILIIVALYQLVLGYAFMNIYIQDDVRSRASSWIEQNIPENSFVVAESANVVDIPLGAVHKYRFASVFVNNIDENVASRQRFINAFEQADYVIVPSRRVFMNYTCYKFVKLKVHKVIKGACKDLEKKYPVIHAYYRELFESGKFEQIAQFTSFPRMYLGGGYAVEFSDEESEETFTVFDHPIVRIYKRKK